MSAIRPALPSSPNALPITGPSKRSERPAPSKASRIVCSVLFETMPSKRPASRRPRNFGPSMGARRASSRFFNNRRMPASPGVAVKVPSKSKKTTRTCPPNGLKVSRSGSGVPGVAAQSDSSQDDDASTSNIGSCQRRREGRGGVGGGGEPPPVGESGGDSSRLSRIPRRAPIPALGAGGPSADPLRLSAPFGASGAGASAVGRGDAAATVMCGGRSRSCPQSLDKGMRRTGFSWASAPMGTAKMQSRRPLVAMAAAFAFAMLLADDNNSDGSGRAVCAGESISPIAGRSVLRRDGKKVPLARTDAAPR
mmetsp:Transcript_7015/g.19956  ORF Transcript_7015/g.19956 Transcript_7015/m.19956 type:complete len:309 (-) Transcript_7015:22-948(-)